MARCPSCTAENPDANRFCSMCGIALTDQYTATVVRSSARYQMENTLPHVISPSESPHGQFLPGTKVTDRYRVVSLIGKGGMGEVYRADDVKLGHTVALKFLPHEVANDPGRLSRFHSEVRLSRRISHPHVCRVHDIGEVAGQHFLSMEYIDGEDLSILLRRIGRLPRDKGIQIAKQLCSGLAAAHEQGILHRDLKPANVMLDGRGKVRITDFGLAQLAVEAGRGGELAGTPAYMAPEQLAHQEATVQSDLYSLGLVLYEMFSGEPVYKTSSIPELLQAHRHAEPPRLSSVIDDADQSVEDVIVRCLTDEPHERPSSASAVSAALPGGDPLTEALAAGETPSPEMVASAGGLIGLSLRSAILSLVIGTACLLVITAGLDPRSAVTLGSLTKKPEAFEENASELLGSLGYPHDKNAFTAYGFAYTPDPMSAEEPDPEWGNSSALEFWYRRSPEPFKTGLVPPLGPKIANEISLHDPPAIVEGMISVRLNPRGQLIEFLAVTPRQSSRRSALEADWSMAFAGAGLNYHDFVDSQTSPLCSPPTHADVVRAWERDQFRIEAASFEGKLAYFQVSRHGQNGSVQQHVARHRIGRLNSQIAVRSLYGETALELIFLLILIVSVGIAILNLRMRRVDKKGVWYLAIFLMASNIAVHLLQTRHYPDLNRWVDTMSEIIVYVVPRSIRHVIYYMALEPYVRRYWPDNLISWSRLLAGRCTDARVGRDILLGWAAAGTLVVIVFTMFRGLMWLDASDPGPIYRFSMFPQTVLSTRQGIASAIFLAANATTSMLFLLWTLFLSRLGFRHAWLAAGSFTLLWTALLSLGSTTAAVWFANAIWFGGFAFLLTRFGLFAAISAAFFFGCISSFPLTTDLSVWYAPQCLFIVVVMTAIVLIGFYHAVGGRTVLKWPFGVRK